jgi:hypothetical protein
LHNENELGGKKMTPTPNTHINWPPLPEHDVEEWSESGITLRYVGWSEEKVLAYAESFCTEQATEIAELKARVAELMPIARFGAMVAAAHMADDLIDAEDLTDGMLAAELLTEDNGVTNYVDGIEEKIMEVLR